MEYYSKKSSRISQVFEANMGLLSKFLSHQQKNALKLVNRSAYYNLITTSLWNDIKMQIVAQKHQYIDDDLELQTNQPELKQQREVKLLRNIRIHSLNKRSAGDSLKKSKQTKETESIVVKQRFPSTFKNRIVTSSKPVLNNLKFMKTEIGFKRMSVNSKSAINYQYLLQLPDKLELSMLEPHGKQSMQLVLQRELLLTEMMNRWLEYQKKILEPMSIELVKQSEQTAYWKVRANLIKQYQTRFKNDKYQKVLKNMGKIIILDEILKKKMTNFNQNNIVIGQYSKVIEEIKSLYETIEQKVNKITQMQNFKYWQQLQDILETYTLKYKQHLQFLSKKILNFLQSVDSLFESGLVALDISIQKLCTNSQQMQLLLELFISIQSKLLYLLQSSESKFKQSLLTTKYTKYKQITVNLSKMTKYFSKIKAQLKQKQKQKKAGNDVKEIQSFIQYYQKYQTQYIVMDEKSTKRVQKQMMDFKKRIEGLKSAVKKQKQGQ